MICKSLCKQKKRKNPDGTIKASETLFYQVSEAFLREVTIRFERISPLKTLVERSFLQFLS